MSPEGLAARLDLARLQAELAADRAVMAGCLEDCRAVLSSWGDPPPERAQQILAAVGLHGWYTGLEALLERVARQIDGRIPAGDRSHRELLSQSMVDVAGSRPAVLPRSLEPGLLALLAFRHFFRHAYGVKLDPARLRLELERLLLLEPVVSRELDEFAAFLQETADALVNLQFFGTAIPTVRNLEKLPSVTDPWMAATGTHPASTWWRPRIEAIPGRAPRAGRTLD